MKTGVDGELNLQTLQTLFLVFNTHNQQSGMIALDKRRFTIAKNGKQITQRTDHAKQILAIISGGVRNDAATFNYHLRAAGRFIARSGCG
jgi:hypothetical protein